MKSLNLIFGTALMALASCQSPQQQITFDPIPVQYPETRKDTVVDDYFGTKVPDPYRWLENDNDPEVMEWVKAQNEVTFGYLSKIPFRDAIAKRLRQLWNYERYGTPDYEGGYYYYFKNDGLQNQSVLYRQPSLEAEPEVVLDPNTFSEDGTVALGGISFNRAGNLMAYQVSESGSDWRKILVRDLEAGKDLSDTIRWVKFSGMAWAGDGFFYARYPEPDDHTYTGRNEFHQVYYHKVGTPQSDDQLVFADHTHPMRLFGVSTTRDERFLVLSVAESTSGNALYYRDLSSDDPTFFPIVEEIKDDWFLVDHVGDELLILTNNEADNWRLIAVNVQNPQRPNRRDVIPEAEDVLEDVVLAGGKLLAHYIHNASSQLKVFSLDGQPLGALELPGIGTVGSISGEPDRNEVFYSFTSFTRPTTIYRLDMETLKSEVWKAPQIDFDSDAYETRQVWYTSKDGTRVPMFITHRKGLKRDGKRPTLLYGYGGFDISILPSFYVPRLVVLENEGVYAVANIRGGGEFGKEWHLAGTRERKQNVFDDFIAAAEYLIEHKYTSPDYLAIEGRSNGGLLIGAVMTQRPELFKVAFPGVGVLDMLRYHLFTIGAAWATDYGRSDNPEMFPYLYAYSPVHNVRPAKYPATLVTTADHDDRVVPAHSFKFIAALQANQQGPDPVLIRIETRAGHGAGVPVSKRIEEEADKLAFMYYNMKVPVKYPLAQKE